MNVYNKLVRDKIPEHLQGKGLPFSIHIADDTEYWQKLKEKLLEEVAEFDQDESIDELADILEVIDAIKIYKQYNEDDIADVKLKKFADRGGFEKRVILEQS